MNKREKLLPVCRHGCWPAVLFVNTPDGCMRFPNDKKQWLCVTHFRELLDNTSGYSVIADIYSLGWIG